MYVDYALLVKRQHIVAVGSNCPKITAFTSIVVGTAVVASGYKPTIAEHIATVQDSIITTIAVDNPNNPFLFIIIWSTQTNF